MKPVRINADRPTDRSLSARIQLEFSDSSWNWSGFRIACVGIVGTEIGRGLSVGSDNFEKKCGIVLKISCSDTIGVCGASPEIREEKVGSQILVPAAAALEACGLQLHREVGVGGSRWQAKAFYWTMGHVEDWSRLIHGLGPSRWEFFEFLFLVKWFVQTCEVRK